jgi:uncharacterized protein
MPLIDHVLSAPIEAHSHQAPAKRRSTRRWVGGPLTALALLGGCATSVPSPTVYVLHSQPPVTPPPVSAVPASAWQLILPVRVPDYLDRDELLLPQGPGAVQPALGHRWAESLASSVPRVLAQDLRTLRGAGSVWTAPLGGAAVQGQLRVELLALDVVPAGQGVRLQARWSIHPTSSGATPGTPVAHTAHFTVPSSSPDVAALVGAHRLALWQLAQAIAGTLP